MANLLSIGLDFGSDSVRAVLVDTVDGTILNSAVFNYPRWAAGKYSDASEARFRQHPLDYLEGTEFVIKSVMAGIEPSRVAGIGIDTTGSTPCAVNREGTPLALTPEFAEEPDAMFILWKDHTALKEADRINEYIAEHPEENYTKYEGGIYSCEWFWAKILHSLRSNPRVRQAAYSWVEHCDWIVGELVGSKQPEKIYRSRCAAGHKAMWHASWGGLPPESFLTAIDPLLGGLRDRLYNETRTADFAAGKLTPEWAARLGLSENVVVAGSAFDAHAGAVGSGAMPYELVKVFGTSTCDIITADIPECIPGICGQVDGSVIPGITGLEAGQASFGDIFAWYKRCLSYTGTELSLAEIEKEAAALPPSDKGVLAIDWFNGRRTPDANAYLQGAILGLNLGTTAPAIYRALVESACCGARRIVERFRENGISVGSLIATGGISRKSPFTMQLCADLLNIPVKVAASDQVC
ncbi:MAG: ribulokinase, partial [Lentisphaeria bacterium]|nr:ribulokinase [Lentisphaeria bacterium]